ncbi:MAG: GNAT family N-acetyltransferase [Tepidisphaeraceae bacterium]
MPPLRRDITLAPLKLDHAQAMYGWMLDPQVSINIGLRSEPSPEKTRAWIENAARDPSVRAFAIAQVGKHIGNVVLDRIDAHLHTARLSIYIGEVSARGSGAGMTAVFLAAETGFGEMKLNKIWLTVHEHNAPAIAAYGRVGFIVEGVLRDEFMLDGKPIAALYMGLLRADFERIRGGA